MGRGDEDRSEWRRPENWRAGVLGVYHAPRDPRVWVPKRQQPLGWTLNFAHGRAWAWLVGVLASAVALAVLLARR